MLLWIYKNPFIVITLRQYFDYLVPAESQIILQITEIMFSALIFNLNQGNLLSISFL